jgi:hypothetical protein
MSDFVDVGGRLYLVEVAELSRPRFIHKLAEPCR